MGFSFGVAKSIRTTAYVAILCAGIGCENPSQPEETARYALRTAGVPSSIELPVYGKFEWVSSGGYKWFDACRRATICPKHTVYSAVDDKYAVDFNVSYKATNADSGLPAVAVAAGTVTSWPPLFPNLRDKPGGGECGGVLIRHSNGWYTGYLHLRDIQVTHGQEVTVDQTIGVISNKCVPDRNNHLHFAAYTPEYNATGTINLLRSQPPSFYASNPFTLALPPSITVPVGGKQQISAVVPFFNSAFKIEDQRYFKNTYWSSLKPSIATVNVSGLVTGVSAGSTYIRLWFSGTQFKDIPITVSETSTTPAFPTNLSAVALSSSSIRLSWQYNSSNEFGFDVLRLNGSSWEDLVSVPADARSYDDTRLAPASTYNYKVCTVFEDGICRVFGDKGRRGIPCPRSRKSDPFSARVQ